MILTLQKSKLQSPLPIELPPSKSHSMRAIILSSFAEGKSEIENLLISGDTNTALGIFTSLGVKFKIDKKNASSADVIVYPPKEGLKKTFDGSTIKIDAKNSGSIFYFLGSLLSLTSSNFVLTGDSSILSRPVAPLLEIYNELGLCYEFLDKEKKAPIKVSGRILTEDKNIYLEGSFSQVVSGLLLGAGLIGYPLKINLKKAGELPYLKMTLHWLKACGIKFNVSHDFKTFKISGGQTISPIYTSIPADWSSAAFPIAAALITCSQLSIRNIDINDVQGDSRIVEILRKMNADICFDDKNKILQIFPSILKGGEFDCSDIPDAVPALSAIACFANGKTILKNIEICRFKECDRLSAIAAELKKLGADIEEGKDFLLIGGQSGKNLRPASVDSHKDHRIAMMLAVIGLGLDIKSQDADFTIQDAECFEISYPSFLDDLKNMCVSMTTT